jgi:hypothetical protein
MFQGGFSVDGPVYYESRSNGSVDADDFSDASAARTDTDILRLSYPAETLPEQLATTILPARWDPHVLTEDSGVLLLPVTGHQGRPGSYVRGHERPIGSIRAVLCDKGLLFLLFEWSQAGPFWRHSAWENARRNQPTTAAQPPCSKTRTYVLRGKKQLLLNRFLLCLQNRHFGVQKSATLTASLV